jgi:SET domain-containing protein
MSRSARPQRRSRYPRIDPRFARFSLCVAKSRIERYGVFADEPIPVGKLVIEYTGEKITLSQSKRRALRQFASGKNVRIYSVRLNQRWIIDASSGGSGAEFVNHSCDPNLTVRKLRGKVLLYSHKKIRRGQELTLDYGFRCSCSCNCGARNCRGTMCHSSPD